MATAAVSTAARGPAAAVEGVAATGAPVKGVSDAGAAAAWGPGGGAAEAMVRNRAAQGSCVGHVYSQECGMCCMGVVQGVM